ncbi:rhodanese-like domain-containing protein [Thermincola potens]|uniref:Rhodanese domain protein n=1 Tax=Thermincola potens (strain JR) TaxID=635013 RepID=D5X9E8_THEPJ|nr:rhodanese-like domain-containing protein [Thermincola potens]ADG83052.1 Rhodanese domain protein [Thermincola potens JR]
MPGKKKLLLSILALVLLVGLAFTFTGCGGGQEEGVVQSDTTENSTAENNTNTPAADGSEAAKIIDATNAYLSSGKAPTISAEEVYEKAVKGGDQSYFLLSIRKPEHYAKGHIKGAINIPYQEIFKKENLAKIPKDKKVVVICYTGHTASQVTLLLNQLGYDAYAMKYGMMGWTSNKDVLAIEPFTKAADYEVDTTAVEAEANNELPAVNTGKSTTEDIILAQTEKYLTSGRAPTISVDEVYNTVVRGGDQGYVVLDIRKPEHYAKGHVKGAINVPLAEIAKEENLKKLPKDKKIVVICYTGHTASQATMFLNQLGYEAYAMKFGMMGWTGNKDIIGLEPFAKAPDYPTVAGSSP